MDAPLAIHIAPENVVLGGDRQGLYRIADELRRQQIFVQTLPYPPIHTPCLSNLRAELLRLLQEEQALVGKPRVDLYSSITASRYPDDERLLFDTLLLNVDRPLRVWQTALQMYRDGARIFVQVGGGHMAAHMRMLPNDCPAVTVALDIEGRHPLTQLQHLLAKLLCQGVSLRLDALYEYHDVRPLDLDAPQPAPVPSRTAVPLRFHWSPLRRDREDSHNPAANAAGSPGSEGEPAALAAGSDSDQRLPVLGRISHLIAGQELVIDRTLDLAEDLFLHDHLFVYAPHKPVAERVPILPLTMSMEFAAEAAALLAPGLSLIGFENVRGSRWVSLYEISTLDIRLEARLLSDDPPSGVRRIRVTLSSAETTHFSATVLLAQAYRQEVDFTLADTAGDGPWPIAAEEVYGERLMFHGPAFQSVTTLDTFGNPGATAALTVRTSDRLFASIPDPQMLTDPCVMDGIGQVVGLWAKMYGLYVLPIGVDKIEFYGPPPPPGTTVPIRIEVVEVNRDAIHMRSHVELGDGQGGVWARLVGWADFIMPASEQYINATDLPHRYVWSQELSLPAARPGSVCTLLTQEHFKGVNLEWTARVFLHAQELTEYKSLDNTARRRQFLASRAAAKDAIRLWWSRRHGRSDLPHPSTFVIAHDAAGRPYPLTLPSPPSGGESGDEGALPRLSIAHTEAGAAAIAADVPVGIDIEPATANTPAILSSFATTAEMVLIKELADASPDSAGPSRLWCAKEAVSKALGTGLQGRPKDFEALAIEEDGSFLIQHGPTGERLAAYTVQVGSFIVAYSPVRGGNLFASPQRQQGTTLAGAAGWQKSYNL